MGMEAGWITRPVLPPIIVERNDRAATGRVGAFFYFAELEDPAKAKISTDRPDVLHIIPGYKSDSAQFTCGANALRPGSAHVKIVPSPEDPNQEPVEVDITVVGAG